MKLADTIYNADGSIAGTTPSSAITALTGDVVANGPGSVASTIQANAVTTSKVNNAAITLAKIANAAANSKWVGSGSGGSGSAYTENSFGSGLTVGASSVDVTTAIKTTALGISLDGGGSALSTGIVADLYVPFACTITAVTMLADQTGSIVVDIWKVAYGSYPATISNTITASDLPTISSAVKSQDTTLTGWTTSISAGDTLRFNINSVSSITRLVLELTVTK